jgi:hypothetical protein
LASIADIYPEDGVVVQRAQRKHALDTALLVPAEDQHTYLMAKRYFYGSVLFIMCSAALFAVLPNTWFTSEMLTALGRWGRLIWPKLDHDATILDVEMPARGIKYVIFVLYCASIMAVGTIVMLPIIVRGLWSGAPRRLTYVESGVWWKALFGISVLVFFTVFDTALIGSDTRLGRSVTNAWGLWFWTALLWWMLFMALGTLIVFAVRRWKYGIAENE